jgi:hypothetical protein
MGDDYMVDHSVAILLINPQAEVAALFQPPHELDSPAGRLSAGCRRPLTATVRSVVQRKASFVLFAGATGAVLTSLYIGRGPGFW